tara:strand:+ start:85 stop:534 length:450 start_codon:yes stop_codon:yes gene_type:complete
VIDNIGIKGELEIEVRKGKKQKVKNAISTELKNVMASALQSAQTFGVGGSLFGTDNFATPTSQENGIVVHTSSAYHETKMTSVTGNTGANTVVLVSSTKANGSSYSFTGAKCGHGYGSDDFDYLIASTTFTQAVNDGQQLDLTWTITIG